MDRLPRGLGGVAHAAACHPHGPMHSLPLSNSPPPSTCCQGHEQGLHPTWSPGGSRDHHISTQGLASPCPESSGPTPLCPFFPSMASPPDSFPSPLCAHRGLSKMVPESPGPHLDCPLPGHAPGHAPIPSTPAPGQLAAPCSVLTPPELPGGDALRPFPGPPLGSPGALPPGPWLPQPCHPGPTNPSPTLNGHLLSLIPRPALATTSCPAHECPPRFPLRPPIFHTITLGAPWQSAPSLSGSWALLLPTSFTRRPGLSSLLGGPCPHVDALCGLCGRQGFRQSLLGLPPTASPRHTVCPQSRSSSPQRRAASGQDGLSPLACPGTSHPAWLHLHSLPSRCYHAGKESLLSYQPMVGASCVWAPPAPAGAMQSCLDLGSTMCAPRALATLHLPISHLGTTRPQPPKARGKTMGLSPLPAPGHSSCRYGPGQASPGSHRDPGGRPSASAAGRWAHMCSCPRSFLGPGSPASCQRPLDEQSISPSFLHHPGLSGLGYLRARNSRKDVCSLTAGRLGGTLSHPQPRQAHHARPGVTAPRRPQPCGVCSGQVTPTCEEVTGLRQDTVCLVLTDVLVFNLI